MLYYSRELLKQIFGYEVVIAVDATQEDSILGELTSAKYIIRLHNDSVAKEPKNKPTPLLSTHAAQLMMGHQREKQAAKRGLLMTILSLILNSKNLQIMDTTLYRYLLELDPTLPGTVEGVTRSKSSKQHNDDDDNHNHDERHILYDWKSIIREEFIKNDYLEYITINNNLDNPNTNNNDPSLQSKGYRLGVGARALIGMLGVYEYNTSLRGKTATSRTITEPDLVTQETVGLLLKQELGSYRRKLPESRLAAVEKEMEKELFGDDNEDEDDYDRSTNIQTNRDEQDNNDEEDNQLTTKNNKKRKSNAHQDDTDSENEGNKRSRR